MQSLKNSEIGNIFIYIFSKTFINESNIQNEEETHSCRAQVLISHL